MNLEFSAVYPSAVAVEMTLFLSRPVASSACRSSYFRLHN
jgi:hypothetical protein